MRAYAVDLRERIVAAVAAGAAHPAVARRFGVAKPVGVCSPANGVPGCPPGASHAATNVSAATSTPTDNR